MSNRLLYADQQKLQREVKKTDMSFPSFAVDRRSQAMRRDSWDIHSRIKLGHEIRSNT